MIVGIERPLPNIFLGQGRRLLIKHSPRHGGALVFVAGYWALHKINNAIVIYVPTCIDVDFWFHGVS
jgi:hypothetical protein